MTAVRDPLKVKERFKIIESKVSKSDKKEKKNENFYKICHSAA